METLLKNALLPIDTIGPDVLHGRYDLFGPNDELILPAVWNSLIQPGMSIKMVMWPVNSAPTGPNQQPPAAAHSQDAPWPLKIFPEPMEPLDPAPPPVARQKTRVIRRPAPLPVSLSDDSDRYYDDESERTEKFRKNPRVETSAMLSFLAGKPSKKNKYSKHVLEPADHPYQEPHAEAFYLRKDKKPLQQKESSGSRKYGPSKNPPSSYDKPPGRSHKPDLAQRFPTTAFRESEIRIPGAELIDDNSSDSSSEAEWGDNSGAGVSRSAARSAGLVISTRRQSEERRPLRQPTFSVLEPNPTPVERNIFSSARVYPDDISPGAAALELTKCSGPAQSTSSLNERDRITWL
jgi:hypothetical protein